MTRYLIILTLLLGPTWSAAETLIAARTIPSKTVVDAADLAYGKSPVPGALGDPGQAIGMETRVVLYAGRPIRPGDLVPPALVDRNDIVIILFQRSGLTIATEGRVLDRGAAGDRVRVMNLASRSTVTGSVGPDGVVRVGPSEALLAQIGGN